MTDPHTPEPLRPMLKAAESELTKALEEACAHEDASDESTAQLMKLEESLVEAAQAAKHAVSLRRRLRTGHRSGEVDEASDVGDRPDATPAAASEGSAVREFRDARGLVWRVWAVTPGQVHPTRTVANRLGEFSQGWLAFETADGSQRRRLPHHPADWGQRTNHGLEILLERAEPVKVRRHGTADDAEAR